MKVANAVLDTENMSFEELTELIRKLDCERACRINMGAFQRKISRLMDEAHRSEIGFMDKQTGRILEKDDIIVYQMRA